MELGSIPNPHLYNQKVWLLPYRFTPVCVPGKEHMEPDCWSRYSDFVSHAPPPAPVDLLDIKNVGAKYSSNLGPSSWVFKPSSALVFFTSYPMNPASYEEEEASEQVEKQMMCRGQESLNDFDAEVAGLQQRPVRRVTWERLQAASNF